MLYTVAASFIIKGKLLSASTLDEAKKNVQIKKLKAIDKYSYTDGFKYVEAVVETKYGGFYSSIRVVFSCPIVAETKEQALAMFENTEVKNTMDNIAKKGYVIDIAEIGVGIFYGRRQV